jgi:predicted NACHT family NTPase
MENLQEIIDRIVAGTFDDKDIQAIISAILDKQLTFSQHLNPISGSGNIIDSQVVPGSKNVLGNSNIVIQIDGAAIQALQNIPSLNSVLAEALTVVEKTISSMDNLVEEVRQKVKSDIQERCGTMRVLDMTQPIGLSDIYTDVNILEKISGRKWMNFSDLMQEFDPESEDFERYGLCKISEKRVPGIDAVRKYPRLMVLGKPGAGKTTFLKYLAIQCIIGNFQAERIPVFITLKQFSEDIHKPNLITFICNCLGKQGIPQDQVDFLLKSGRLLILFDGLDEVSEEDSKRVIHEIRDFTEKYFFSNVFNSEFNEFIEKLVSKFKAISLSSKNKAKTTYSEWIKKEFSLPDKLLRKVEAIFEEVVTKVDKGILKIDDTVDYQKLVKEFSGKFDEIPRHEYLNYFYSIHPAFTYNNCFVITCRIAAREEKFEQFTEVEVADFDENQIEIFVSKWFSTRNPNPSQAFMKQLELVHRIKELATNPLLLTLLCLVFQETFDFPLNRSELYKEGVNILLKKWDAERLIKRDKGYEIYRKLSASRKEDLLSHIAFITFERKEYFFKQRDAERYIAEYIQNLPDIQLSPESLQLDSEAVLKSIEAQHGLLIERARSIYSFSHLTFQEYFTARKIIMNSSPQNLESGLQNLASHILEKRWREVLLLSLGMLTDADRLLQLLKQKADSILLKSEKLQDLLQWIHQKSLEIKAPYNNASVRAFYLSHIYNLAIASQDSQIIDYQLSCSLDSSLNSEMLNNAHGVLCRMYEAQRRAFPHRNDPSFVLMIASLQEESFRILFNDKTQSDLKTLREQIPIKSGKSRFESWWVTNSRTWTLQFKSIVDNLDFGNKWKLDNSQIALLKKYHDANLLLADCLRGDYYISLRVRQDLEQTLLLPPTFRK